MTDRTPTGSDARMTSAQVKRYSGVVVRVAYYASTPERDHVDVRLASGEIVPTYRFAVRETAPQECADESWRRRAALTGDPK
jgi:hypothetical protein